MNWYLPRYEVVKKKETTIYRYNDEQIRFKNTHTHTDSSAGRGKHSQLKAGV